MAAALRRCGSGFGLGRSPCVTFPARRIGLLRPIALLRPNAVHGPVAPAWIAQSWAVSFSTSSSGSGSGSAPGKGNTVKKGDRAITHLKITDPMTKKEIIDTRAEDRGPVSFIVGQGAVLPGLEKYVIGMKVGESWERTLGPEDLFGERSENAIVKVPRSAAERDVQAIPKVGSKVQLNDNSYGAVVQVDDAYIHVDCNHEYAGRELTMFVLLDEIEENPQASWSGVQLQELQAGDGKTFPKKGDTVSVHYIGMLAETGKVFDSSIKTEPIKFVLGAGRVIRGWEDGISRLSLGQRARLFIASEFAYGSAGAGGGLIKPNANLIFDVELVAINGATLPKK